MTLLVSNLSMEMCQHEVMRCRGPWPRSSVVACMCPCLACSVWSWWPQPPASWPGSPCRCGTSAPVPLRLSMVPRTAANGGRGPGTEVRSGVHGSERRFSVCCATLRDTRRVPNARPDASEHVQLVLDGVLCKRHALGSDYIQLVGKLLPWLQRCVTQTVGVVCWRQCSSVGRLCKHAAADQLQSRVGLDPVSTVPSGAGYGRPAVGIKGQRNIPTRSAVIDISAC